MNINDYKEEYEKFVIRKNLKNKEALEAVRQDGLALQFVNEQTEEICLEAVRQNGLALRYVNEQTEKICLEAVRKDGLALRYVNEDIFHEEQYTIQQLKEKAGVPKTAKIILE